MGECNYCDGIEPCDECGHHMFEDDELYCPEEYDDPTMYGYEGDGH